jgi:threonylcarbamoyladenosine tRNA methylthiotransferase MtaB
MKIFLDTIGCRLNQAELEQMARQFRSAGHEIVASASQADLAVINTCTVTSAAAADSRAAIRRAARQGVKQIAATGCWATLEPNAAGALPGVTSIIPNPQKDTLAADLLGLPPEYFDLEPLARQPLPGLHARTRAFIKVQDGCDNACTFCITTQARGASRSRPADKVLGDVNSALAGGTREIVLTGVHLGAWGQDLATPHQLADLVSMLLSSASIPRLRLSSLEPWDLDADFFHLWEHPALCRHLHLPLQSGSPGVLKRMRRRTSAEDFATLVTEARSIIPQVAITTDLIAGFPGETEAEFNETLDFLDRMKFAAGHVFTYSPRPGTPAARLPSQVDSETARERSARLRLALARSAQVYRRSFVGKTLSVLWESTSRLSDSGWRMEGLTDNYLRLAALAPQPRWNQVDMVKITGMDDENLAGTILDLPKTSFT